MTWVDWIEDYAESLQVRGLAAGTVHIRHTWVTHFAVFCGRCRPPVGPLGVLHRHVMAYRRATQPPRYAQGTQDMALCSIRGFFHWAVHVGRLLVDPTAGLVVPRHVSLAVVRLTTGQVESLLVPPEPATPVALRNWAVLEMLYGTGIRRGECHALNLHDADLPAGSLWVRLGKGREGRLLPMGPHLVGVLNTYLRHSRPLLGMQAGETALFVARGGGRLSYVSMAVLLRQAGQRIGLSGLGAHALRRACATHTLAAGADLESVQQLLGHGCGDTTQGYAPLEWDQVKAEHRRTHPRTQPSDN